MVCSEIHKTCGLPMLNPILQHVPDTNPPATLFICEETANDYVLQTLSNQVI